MSGRLGTLISTAVGVYLALGLSLAVANATTLVYFTTIARLGDGSSSLSMREYGLWVAAGAALFFAVTVRRVVAFCRLPLERLGKGSDAAPVEPRTTEKP